MAQLTLRFYGRFVYAEPTFKGAPTGRLNVLAVNPQFNPDVCADSHRLMMTVRRTDVAIGSRRPDMRVFSAEDGSCAEYAAWDLCDHEIVLDRMTRFEWLDSNHELLKDIHTLGKSDFDPSHLYSRGTGCATAGLIRLGSGVGRPRQLESGTLTDFVYLREPDTNQPPLPNQTIADVVEVTLTTDEPLMFRLCRRGGGAGSTIVVTPEDGVVVSISNLCAAGHRRVDDEFAGYYELLKAPPAVLDRLVPRAQPTGGIRFDCYTGGYAAYETTV